MLPYSKLGKENRKNMVDIVPLEVPFTLFIEPSNICNFKCVHCPHGLDSYEELAGPLGNMDERCFEKIIKDLNAWKKDVNIEDELLKVVRLYLEGEPFVNTSIVEMIRLLKEYRIAERIEIVTNGSLLKPDVCEKLVKYGLDYITISIYAIEKEKHCQVTKTKVSPEQIRDNIKYLREVRDRKGKSRPFIYTKIIDTYSDEENQKFKNYYEEIADETCIEKPMNWNSNEQIDFIDKMYEKEVSQMAKEELQKRKYRKVCPYPFHTMSVKSNGDVLVCCVDWKRKTKVGNILEEGRTLKNIWGGKNCII